MDLIKNEKLQRILTPDHEDDRYWRAALARLQAGDVDLTRRTADEHAVAAVQRLLIFLGYSSASGGGFLIDGDFGRGTNRGLAQFQFDHGLARGIDRETLCYECTFRNARSRIVRIPESRLTVATLHRMGETALAAIEAGDLLCGDFEEALRQLDALHARRYMKCTDILDFYGEAVFRACEAHEAESGRVVHPAWVLATIRQESAGIIRPRFEQHVLSRWNEREPSTDLVELRYRSMSQGLGQVMGENYAIVGADSARAMYTAPVPEQVAFVIRFYTNSRVLRPVVAKANPGEGDFHDFARIYNGPMYRTHHYHEHMQRWFQAFKTLLADRPTAGPAQPAPTRRKYRKRPAALVTAVRLALDFEGFAYRKWGGEQRCAADDWLVDNEGDVYTVSADSFARTYSERSAGRYFKRGEVWAVQARAAGQVPTKEGSTAYVRDDYLVSNHQDGGDAYAVERAKFEAMYEPVPDSGPVRE